MGTDCPPATRVSLANDIAATGVTAGDVLLVHSSLRAVGWVCGGPVAFVQALLDVVGPQGTLVVFSQSPENRDPQRWTHLPVPPAWWPVIREHLPAFSPEYTPCREMGLVAETVRTWPGTVRSQHPQTSFAALGARSSDIVATHDLTSELGERSPLRALEQASGRVLLIGVGYDRCTAFHLAEYRQPAHPVVAKSCAVMTGEGRRWITYEGRELDASDFADLGRDYEADGATVNHGTIGQAKARLLPVREAVAFATCWLRRRRAARVSG
jgi:aminoglycoside 3-N-acetyltransferase